MVTMIFIGLYYLAIYRAGYLFEELVTSQSDGKLELNVKKAEFNVFRLRFDFKNPEILTKDTVGSANSYAIQADRIYINVNSLISLYFFKHIVVDSVLIESPSINLIQLKEGKQKKISIPEELHKAYTILEKVLNVVNLNSLKINNASFQFYKKTLDDPNPLKLSNVFLTIDQFSQEQKDTKKGFLYADRILLEIYDADISLGEGNKGIKFKRFWMGTKSQTVKLDSCYLYNYPNDSAGNHYEVFLDSIRIIKLDLNEFATNNRIVFDSAYCINPTVDLSLKARNNTKAHSGSNKLNQNFHFNDKIVGLTGDLFAGYLALKNTSFKLSLKKNDKTNKLSADRCDFVFDSLVIDRKNDQPVYAKKIKLDINNHTFVTPDSLFILKFDALSLMNKEIKLHNFSLLPTKHNKRSDITFLKASVFELDSMNWSTLLSESKIYATQAILIRPEVKMKIRTNINRADQTNTINQPKATESISNKLDLNDLIIQNGDFIIDLNEKERIEIKSLDLHVKVNKVTSATSEPEFFDGLDYLSFKKGLFESSKSKIYALDAKYSKSEGVTHIRKVDFNSTDESTSVSVDHFRMEGLLIRSVRDISIGFFSYRTVNATFSKRNDVSTKEPQAREGETFNYNLGGFKGGETNVNFSSDDVIVALKLNQLAGNSLKVVEGQKPEIAGLFIEGNYLKFDQKNGVKASVEAFQIADKKVSYFKNTHLQLPLHNEKLKLTVPELVYSIDINSALRGSPKLNFVTIKKPKISFEQYGDEKPHIKERQENHKEMPAFSIKTFNIEEPEVLNYPTELSSKLLIKPGISHWKLKGINSIHGALSVDSMAVTMDHPQLVSENLDSDVETNGKLELGVSGMKFKPGKLNEKSEWEFHLNQLGISDFPVHFRNNEGVDQSIMIQSIAIQDLHLNDSHAGLLDIVNEENDDLKVSDGNFGFYNDKTHFDVHNFSFNKKSNSIQIDSIYFRPAMDKEAFTQSKDFQSTYLKLRTGKIEIGNVDLQTLLNEKELRSTKVTLDDLKLYTYKDKRLPFQHGVTKPMLTEMLHGLKPKIAIDSLVFKNGLIEYEEFNKMTQQIGKINLTEIRGALANIKTNNASVTDSLRLNVFAKLLDTAELRVKYKQSYLDSLYGFHLKLVVNSFDLRALNPILQPFASADIKSGTLDTIRMSVVGRKYVAYGVMKMFYDNLNVQYLKKGDSTNKTIVTKSVSFFANRLVHKRNKWKTGEVYAERDHEKAFVNYWVKTVIGGVLTNTGVRSNKKQERKYEHAIKKYEVPPIPNIPVDF